VDTVTVAHILGHRDPSMVSRVYGMVQHDPKHMSESVKKARKIQDTVYGVRREEPDPDAGGGSSESKGYRLSP
jgi:hypothetical protein